MEPWTNAGDGKLTCQLRTPAIGPGSPHWRSGNVADGHGEDFLTSGDSDVYDRLLGPRFAVELLVLVACAPDSLVSDGLSLVPCYPPVSAMVSIVADARDVVNLKSPNAGPCPNAASQGSDGFQCDQNDVFLVQRGGGVDNEVGPVCRAVLPVLDVCLEFSTVQRKNSSR